MYANIYKNKKHIFYRYFGILAKLYTLYKVLQENQNMCEQQMYFISLYTAGAELCSVWPLAFTFSDSESSCSKSENKSKSPFSFKVKNPPL